MGQRHLFILLFIILQSIFLLHYYVVGQAVYGDGIYYYSITRSLYKDHNVNFANEFGHLYSPQNNNAVIPTPIGTVSSTTNTNLVPNFYPLGAPLSWLPAFFVADTFAVTLNYFNKNTPLLGYSDLYQISVGTWNIIFIIISSLLLWKVLSKYFSSSISLLSITTLIFGSNLLYYGSIDVINSHPFSFLLSSALFFTVMKSYGQYSMRQYFILGLLVGLMALTRTQDGIFLLIPFAVIIMQMQRKTLKSKKMPIIFYGKAVLLTLLGFIIGFFPQPVMWGIIYGSVSANPYITQDSGFNFLEPNILGVLFNYKTGIVFWSLFYFISFVGLFLLRKKIPFIAILSIGLVLIQFYVISSWSGWTQGEAFGNRMLISTLPFLVLGYAALVEKVKEKVGMTLVTTFSFFLIIFNNVLILYFLTVAQSPTFILGEATNNINFQRFLELLSF